MQVVKTLKTALLCMLLPPAFMGCEIVGSDSDKPSLEQKIGQMLMVGFRGVDISPQDGIWQDIEARNLGGVVLYNYDTPSGGEVERNIASPEQLKTLTTTLQGIRPDTLLIGVDQEGGLIRRLKPTSGFPDEASPSHQTLGDVDDLANTYSAAKEIATLLDEHGININFAPVVDVNTNPDNPVIGALQRSFSADPDKVTAHSRAYIAAHHDVGVLTTLKHFPGHGSSTEDSHLGITDVTNTWQALELQPYRDLVGEGVVDLVMTAHVFNANLDPNHPATLSPAVVSDLLRRDIGFDGVVVSDDMQMGAIVQYYGFEEALTRAIKAGVDLLVISNNNPDVGYDPAVAARAAEHIESLVVSGELSSERIDASYRRIQALKRRLAE